MTTQNFVWEKLFTLIPSNIFQFLRNINQMAKEQISGGPWVCCLMMGTVRRIENAVIGF